MSREPEPGDVLFELLQGFLATRALSVAVELGVADELTERPLDVDVLAARVGAVPSVLYRFLRALATRGVFAEGPERTFANTAASELLRRDAGSGWRDFVVVYDSVYRSLSEAPAAVRTGENMFQRVHGVDWWTWLSRHPDLGVVFNRAMQAGARRRLELLADASWRGDERVVDVGGGNGSLLVGLLERHEGLRGVVYDLPEVARAAETRVHEAGLAGRCEVEPGSFFERVPTGGDAYVLAKVLHDWDDDRASAILGRVRDAVAPGTRLFVLDSVVDSGNEPDPAKWVDLVMLVLVDGKERTESEWRRLLTDGGFRITLLSRELIEATAV